MRFSNPIMSWMVLVGPILALFVGPDRVSGEEKSTPVDPLPFVVVVHPENPIDKINVVDLRRIFLKQSVKWDDGTTVTPFDLRVSDPLRLSFAERVLGVSPRELGDYWLNLRLSRGIRPPKACGSGRLVTAYVSRTRGGIGYVDPADLSDTVKRIEVTGLE